MSRATTVVNLCLASGAAGAALALRRATPAPDRLPELPAPWRARERDWYPTEKALRVLHPEDFR